MRGECGIGSVLKQIGEMEDETKPKNGFIKSIVTFFGAIFMISIFGIIGIIDFLFGEKKKSQKSQIDNIPYKIEPKSN